MPKNKTRGNVKKELKARLRKIKLFMIDVDGVLAKSSIIWAGSLSGDGLHEIKEFCVHDGAASWAAKEAGLLRVLVSGRDSAVVRQRAERMKVDGIYLNNLNKLEILEALKKEHHLLDAEIAYIGDDFLDLPILKKVGFPVAVQDAVPEVKKAARYITRKKGGEGAVAETIRLILNSQGKWKKGYEKAIEKAYNSSSH